MRLLARTDDDWAASTLGIVIFRMAAQLSALVTLSPVIRFELGILLDSNLIVWVYLQGYETRALTKDALPR